MKVSTKLHQLLACDALIVLFQISFVQQRPVPCTGLHCTTLHECLPPQHSPTLRPPISRIERPPTPRLSSSLDSRTTRAREIPFAALASVPSGFVLVRAVWIHRIAHCALPHSTPSTPTPTTGPRAVSSAIPQVQVALSSHEKFKS